MKAREVPHKFWEEAMNTSCHIINRVYLRANTDMTPYEIWKGKKPNVKYFHIFGVVCYVLRDRTHNKKLDDKSEEAIFLGYAANSRAFRVFLKSSQKVMESINVVFDDYNTPTYSVSDHETHQTNLVDESVEESGMMENSEEESSSQVITH